MYRRVAYLLAIAGCSPPAPAPEAAPPIWVYPPASIGWPLGEVRGRIGRSQPPQLPVPAGVVGETRVPLRLATPWPVPGDGPARAVMLGREGEHSALELVDIDRGRAMWRVENECNAIVGVTAETIVCADARGIAGIGLDGKRRWKTDATYLAMTGDRIVTAAPAEAVILDAEDGEELSRVALPEGVSFEAIVASCGDAGRELFAAGQDGTLARIAEAKGGPAVAWAVPIGRIDELDACAGDSILVREAGVDGGALVAIARATGTITGRIEGVHGSWAARDGSERLEIATAVGLARWPRDLAGPPVWISDLPLGELVAARGDARLVRASRLTAVLLDRDGVRAYLPFAGMGAVLGDEALLGSSWTGSSGNTPWRLGLPARYRRALRLPGPRAGVAVPAELRDLPVVSPLELHTAVAQPDTGKHAVLDVVIDPEDSAVLYTLQLERPEGDAVSAGIASVDLAKRAWRWQRADGCAPGEPIGLAVAHEVVVCASRAVSPPSATARATSRDGAARWEWEGDNIDHVIAAGGVVVVFDGGRAVVLDAATGRVRGHLASDDGDRVRAAVVELEDITFVITYERGRLLARLPMAGMLPAWSYAVDGIVESIARSARGALVALEDGDAYLVDALTAAVVAAPGLNLAWHAEGDVITGHTLGGPIPGVVPVASLRPPPVRRARAPKRQFRGPRSSPELEFRPRLWTPIPPPPPLGDSWQYTLYELDGGLRARNDYALTAPVEIARARGPAGSPLVISSGPGLRDVLVLDPRNGDPLRRVQLPEEAAAGLVFGTIVGGTPVAGAILPAPLRIIVF